MKEVIVQMEKDLQMSALEYRFKSIDPYELISELENHLLKMDKYHDLRNFFYRVDLPQKWLTSSNYHELAEKLWDRELKKVWIRKTYSNNSMIT
ncbi:MAG: hypothetical protein JXR19_08435 [Bacteroidia bacterium]